MTANDTLSGFARVPRHSRTWRLIHFHLRAKPDLLAIAQLLAVGVTDSRRMASALDAPIETIDRRKATLHREVVALTTSIKRGRHLATRFKRQHSPH